MRFQGVTFLNIDGTYAPQQRLLQLPHEWIDATDITETNLYCEQKSLAEIEERLSERRFHGMTFIGSGNYHYVSYLLMKHIQEPFTLVLFDHHTDIGTNEDAVISCGSWVSHALTIRALDKVIIVGPSGRLPSFPNNITIFPTLPSPKFLFSHIQTKYVYISIDKDVLCREDAVTNWEQGTMSLLFLLRCLQMLLMHKQVVGVDVCGEYPQAAVDLFHPLHREANRKNEHANLCIAETYLHYMLNHPRLA
ncbi:arginase family protein [Anoxybacteroides amylolyticum]|uniref:Arginase family protein n=1 Tax=Anoxybacteroides amylolyticum TaxID=294699 RepID=A0A167T0E8_9BACL|nr:arginase family protein [Anoxybacillus amylolyticus]ANB59254.1 arginase family protein [Anoxybacillus amylolyticus]